MTTASARLPRARDADGTFEAFSWLTISTNEATLVTRVGGTGPPILLLHGHPQCHVMWHAVAPRLAERFTVVAIDLRGYGDSSRPPAGPNHEAYSKRAMARDGVAVMANLGFERFVVAGHDRGGRVAYRMALDFPERVAKLAVLDIIPTGDAWRGANRAFMLSYWHWAFLAQPSPLPERLIGADPDAYYFRGDASLFDTAALAEYRRHVRNPETIRAMCEDYRAGASIDFELDEADRGTRRIACPVLALWGGRGDLGQGSDVLGIWRNWADDVSGFAVDCGHYLAEEAPDVTAEALLSFFS
jgi:haloacetate dehalogenase